MSSRLYWFFCANLLIDLQNLKRSLAPVQYALKNTSETSASWTDTNLRSTKGEKMKKVFIYSKTTQQPYLHLDMIIILRSVCTYGPFLKLCCKLLNNFFCSVVDMQMIINSKFPFLNNNNKPVQFSHIIIWKQWYVKK